MLAVGPPLHWHRDGASQQFVSAGLAPPVADQKGVYLILIQHEQLVPRDDAEPGVPTGTVIRGMNVLGSVHRGSPYIWGTETHKQ